MKSSKRGGSAPDFRGTLEERFWARVDVRNMNSCWLWTGKADRHGYGRISVYGHRGQKLAHRVCWELLVGPIPDGIVLDHDNPDFGCGNPSCVNPDHLEMTTQKKNTQRRRGLDAHNKSGHRGVSWYEPRQKWLVRVVCEGKTHHGGYFLSLDEAVACRDALHQKLFGQLPK